MRNLASLVIIAMLAGCVSTPTGKELSPAGRIALAEASNIAVRRYLAEHADAAGRIANIREIVAQLQSISGESTITGLRDFVTAEIDRRVTDPLDRADAKSLANILYAVVLEYVGTDKIDSTAIVKVNEVLSMILAALPAR